MDFIIINHFCLNIYWQSYFNITHIALPTIKKQIIDLLPLFLTLFIIVVRKPNSNNHSSNCLMYILSQNKYPLFGNLIIPSCLITKLLKLLQF